MLVRSARKHIAWYVKALPGAGDFLAAMNRIEDSDAQWQAVAGYFEELAQSMDRMPAAVAAGEDLDETVEATA